MEWVIIDDGEDKIGDLVKDVEGVKYFSYDEKIKLGRKRNLMHEKCKGALWLVGTSKILQLLGLKNVVVGDLVYVDRGKFPKGYSRTDPADLDILDRAKDLLNKEDINA